jgi:hypothetical protein
MLDQVEGIAPALAISMIAPNASAGAAHLNDKAVVGAEPYFISVPIRWPLTC